MDIRETDANLLGENGIQLTQKLFYEFDTKECIYTLSTRDKVKEGVTYPSLYLIYMDSVDEYEAAMRLVGNMEHWRKLCSLKWFMEGMPERGWPGLKQVREDMAMRDASLAKKNLVDSVKDGNVNASKFLYDSATKGKSRKKEEPKETLQESRVAQIVSNMQLGR